MKTLKHLTVLLLAVLLGFTASAQAAGKSSPTPTPAPRDISAEVVEDIPETIQQLLDLAYGEMIETDAMAE